MVCLSQASAQMSVSSLKLCCRLITSTRLGNGLHLAAVLTCLPVCGVSRTGCGPFVPVAALRSRPASPIGPAMASAAVGAAQASVEVGAAPHHSATPAQLHKTSSAASFHAHVTKSAVASTTDLELPGVDAPHAADPSSPPPLASEMHHSTVCTTGVGPGRCHQLPWLHRPVCQVNSCHHHFCAQQALSHSMHSFNLYWLQSPNHKCAGKTVQVELWKYEI